MKKTILFITIPLLIIFLAILLITIMFPKKYIDEISLYSKEFDLPKYLLASVINIESGYDNFAVSSAEAKGLMQLKITTAEDMAKRLDIEVNEEDIFEVSKNIRLGASYLRYLLDIFDGNIINTLASYNWGLGNVREWVDKGNVDNEGTITNIPVKETAQYLRKYSVNKFVYQSIYKM